MDIYTFILLEKSNCPEMDAAVGNAHRMPPHPTAADLSFLLDIIMDQRWTKPVRKGAPASYCWIYEVESCEAAQQALLEELSDSDSESE